MTYKKDIRLDIIKLNKIASVWKPKMELGNHKQLINKTYSLIRRLYIRLVLNNEIKDVDESLDSLITLKYLAKLNGHEKSMLKLLIFYCRYKLFNDGEDEYEVYNSGARDMEWMESLPKKYQK